MSGIGDLLRQVSIWKNHNYNIYVKVNAYFPPGLWYDLKFHSQHQSTVGQRVKLDCPLNDIKLYVRSGHVLVTQQPKVTTEETRKGNFELLVALDSYGTASGSMYWDSGDGLNTFTKQEYDLIDFDTKNVIRIFP